MRVIFYILLIILICTGYSLSPEWHYYILDKTPTGISNSIVLDSNDKPYILFYYDGGHALTLAHWVGYKWIYEPISSYEHYGNALSMAIDKNDNLYAAFIDTVTWDLMYGYKNDEGWSIYRVDEDDETIGNSIAVDSKGYPHIAYCRAYNNEDNTELRYAYFDGKEWNIEVVDNEYQEEGCFCSLALDLNDYPHISYMEYVPNSGWNLKYARWDGTKWIKELISAESYSFGHFNTDIVIDSNNKPHIVYRGGSGYKYLYYLYFDGSSWHKEVVDLCFGGLSLTLDSNEYPCIAYLSTLYIKYAHWDGSKWIIENAKRGSGLGQLQISLALDSSDYPHITCDNFFSEPWSIWYIWYGEPLVGINLTSFSATPSGRTVVLDWAISTDEDISGFNLYRRTTPPGVIHELPIQYPTVGAIHELSTPVYTLSPVGENAHSPLQIRDDLQWTKINTSLITGTNPYSYTDRTVIPDTTYEYKLEAVISDRSETLGTTTGRSQNPSSFEIISIYPNPSSGVFTLKYKGDTSELNDIKIYDISGRLVKRIECLSSDINSVNINDNTSEKEIQLDLKALNNGIYILSVDKEVYKNILICK